MVFSELDAILVAHEISRVFGGLGVHDVLGAGNEMVISFKHRGIYIKTRPPGARCHGIWRQIPLPKHPWRQELRGAVFARAQARPGDRIIKLFFVRRDPLGHGVEMTLIAELTGKYGNAVLVDETGTIVDALRRVRPSESRHRALLPKRPYQPPPPKYPNALALAGPELLEYLERYAPHIAEEIRLSPEPPGDALSSYMERAMDMPRPGLYLREGQALFPAPGAHESQKGAEFVEFTHYSEAMDVFFGLVEHPGPGAEPSRAQKRRIRALKKRLAEEEAAAKRCYAMGQAILANLARIREKDTRLEVDGLVIPLDPRLSPGQNAQRYFARYKRAKRGIEKIKSLLAGETPVPEKEAGPRAPAPEEKEGPASGPGYKEFTSPGGFKVLVGTSAKSNEKLTFGMARAHDLFFHVRGSPGAHVILRTGGREVPEEDILFAARLALEHSRAGPGAQGLVSYTPRRYVARPRGAREGLVVLLKEKVVRVKAGE